MTIPDQVIYTFIGIVLVIIIDTIGSLTSRLLKFNYNYFGVLSFLAYTFTAWKVAGKTGLWATAVISVMLVCLFDAIFGWEISRRLKANYGKHKELVEKLTPAHRIFYAIFMSIICGAIGIFLANA